MKTLKTLLCASVVALGFGACTSNVAQIEKLQEKWANVKTDEDALAVADAQKEFLASLDSASLDESEYEALARMDAAAIEALSNVSEQTRTQIASLFGLPIEVEGTEDDSITTQSTLDLGDIQD